jgi:hypothetical protein
MIGAAYLPCGWQTLTVTGTVGSLTVPVLADSCLISTDANVRFRDDGGQPTGSVGVLLPTGIAPFFYTGTLSALRFIAVTGTANLNINYYSTSG